MIMCTVHHKEAKMIKVRVKEPFETKVHRVIAKQKGEIINMPEEDYEEVEDLVERIEKIDKKKTKKE